MGPLSLESRKENLWKSHPLHLQWALAWYINQLLQYLVCFKVTKIIHAYDRMEGILGLYIHDLTQSLQHPC